MTNIETRAEKEIPYTYSCHGEILDELQTNDERKTYIRACRDQLKIDIEMACEWLDANLVDSDTFDKEWFVGRFKEAMEEAK